MPRRKPLPELNLGRDIKPMTMAELIRMDMVQHLQSYQAIRSFMVKPDPKRTEELANLVDTVNLVLLDEYGISLGHLVSLSNQHLLTIGECLRCEFDEHYKKVEREISEYEKGT